MKKFALLLSLLAFAGNYASEGSILVNTVSFADLPPKVKSNDIAKVKKLTKVKPAPTCVIKVKSCPQATRTVARVCSPRPVSKTRMVIAKSMTCLNGSLLN